LVVEDAEQMPLYEYECDKCGSRIEVIQRVGDGPPGACSECGGEMKKLLSAPAFQFKGSGWYVTDYARKSESSEKSSKSSSSEGSGGEKTKTATTDSSSKGVKKDKD
jgi:putative FmdB family regulatory protein